MPDNPGFDWPWLVFNVFASGFVCLFACLLVCLFLELLTSEHYLVVGGAGGGGGGGGDQREREYRLSC